MKVLTFGTFDHLHKGHIAYISEAQQHGDVYIIVARDQNVEHIKGRAPDQSEQERMAALQDVFPNATVLLGDTEDYLKPVQDIAPDLIMMGYDQRLPPHIKETDLPCKIQRASALSPEEYKSSKLRKNA